MNKLTILFSASLLIMSCTREKEQSSAYPKPDSVPALDSLKTVTEINRGPVNEKGTTVETRFIPPNGFERKADDENSFSTYLRNHPLKPAGSQVRYFDGAIKDDDDVYDAVVDM